MNSGSMAASNIRRRQGEYTLSDPSLRKSNETDCVRFRALDMTNVRGEASVW